MTTGMEEQVKRTIAVCNEASVTGFTIADQDALHVAKAQEEVLEAYGRLLEEKERELVEELRRLSIEYGARIAVVRDMLRQLGRDIEKRVVWKERLQEGSNHE